MKLSLFASIRCELAGTIGVYRVQSTCSHFSQDPSCDTEIRRTWRRFHEFTPQSAKRHTPTTTTRTYIKFLGVVIARARGHPLECSAHRMDMFTMLDCVYFVAPRLSPTSATSQTHAKNEFSTRDSACFDCPRRILRWVWARFRAFVAK